MTVRVVAFGRVRELLGWSERVLTLADATRVGDVWQTLTATTIVLASLAPATRIARNGVIAHDDAPLADGDELALLPPVGGG